MHEHLCFNVYIMCLWVIILTHGLSDGVCETLLLIFYTLLGLQRYRQKTIMFSVTYMHLYTYRKKLQHNTDTSWISHIILCTLFSQSTLHNEKHECNVINVFVWFGVVMALFMGVFGVVVWRLCVSCVCMWFTVNSPHALSLSHTHIISLMEHPQTPKEAIKLPSWSWLY